MNYGIKYNSRRRAGTQSFPRRQKTEKDVRRRKIRYYPGENVDVPETGSMAGMTTTEY